MHIPVVLFRSTVNMASSCKTMLSYKNEAKATNLSKVVWKALSSASSSTVREVLTVESGLERVEGSLGFPYFVTNQSVVYLCIV